LMGFLTVFGPVREAAKTIYWQARFSEVSTRTGFTTRAESGPAFRLFMYPGTLIGIVALAAVALTFTAHRNSQTRERLKTAGIATWRSGASTSA
ncbi:hypothetical protein PTM75_15165, partial [Clostridium perfringens]|nr:hypothetical protein [Clostridium perfringens]